MKKFLKTRFSYRNLIVTIIFTLLLVITIFVSCKIYNLYCSSNQSNPTFTKGDVKIEMIDVDNGDSYLVLQNDEVLLVDTGYFTTYSSVKKTLKKWNVKKINYLILTHPHRDHAGGFVELIFDYHIDNIIVGNNPPTSIMDSGEKRFYSIYTFILNLSEKLGDNIYQAQNSDGSFNDFEFSDSEIHFLGPKSSVSYDKVNNYSLVFKLTYGNARILFTGDEEELNEQELLDSGENLRADILKIAHHGSKTSNCREFLEAVSPTIAIVSAKNEIGTLYGHPGKTLVKNLEELGVKLYRTDEQGNQVFTMSQDKIYFGIESGDYQSGTELFSSAKK